MNLPSNPDQPVPSEEPHDTYRLSIESPLAKEGIQPPPPVRTFAQKKTAKPKSQMAGTLVGYNALVFVTSVCVMTLELTASRLIAKHVGSSLYTWTSVIGVVLAGITLGNWLGGWLADRYDRARSLAWSYVLASVACGSVLWLDQLIGTIGRPESLSWPTWVVTVVGAIFLLPALALGTTSPLVASMALQKSTKTGSTVGNVYAWGALGSIVGTFLTGFYLIDIWGTRSIVGMTAVTLAILAIIVAAGRRVFQTAVVLGWIQLLGWTLLVATSNAEACANIASAFATYSSLGTSNPDASVRLVEWHDFGKRVGENLHELGLALRLRDDAPGDYRDESNYSDINVSDTSIDGKTVKSLRLDKLIHSYYDPADPTALHYDYEKVYAAVTKKVAAPTSTEVLTIPLDGVTSVTITADNLPNGVEFDEANNLLRVERPDNEVFVGLLGLAPEAEYWKAVEYLYRETNKPLWGGFSSYSLPILPEGVVISDDISVSLRHDETLGVLIAYQPLSAADRDRLIASTSSYAWFQKIADIRGNSRKSTACFYGGGGYIFPRWFLQEFPGSPRIDVAELDPAVLAVVSSELGFTEDLEKRIHTTIGDARNFVDDRLRENAKRRGRNEPTVTYDFIYADAFNDFSIPWHLTTREFLQKTHDLLSDRGVFQANLIDIYPRTEFPGTSAGSAEAEYQGRLPKGVLSDDARRDKLVPATRAFAPLEVAEQFMDRYRLRVAQTITSADAKRLNHVTWPEPKSAKSLSIVNTFQPEIDVSVERENWRKAIEQLQTQSQKKMPYQGSIPEQLKVAGGILEGWVSAASPYEFVEAFRIDGERHLLGFRGVVSRDDEQKLVDLDPKNEAWVDAVRKSAAKSRSQTSGRFMGRYLASAARVFPNVYLFSTSQQQPDATRDTFVMVCSRQPLDLKSLDDTGDWTGGPFASMETFPGKSEPVLSGQMSAVIGLAEGQILTDDFAPVDNLLVPVFDAQE